MGAPRLLEDLLAEQRQRWQAGEPARVEEYLGRHPALAGDPEAVLDLIYNEVLLREQHGDPPRLDDYLARFPHLAEQLRAQFEVHSAFPVEDDEGAPVRDTRVVGAAGAPGGRAGVSGYEVGRELGRGSMGVVYEARQLALKRRVALKMIRGYGTVPPDVRVRFLTEAQAVARLQHPNIVQVYEVGEHDGEPFISLELVAAGNLAQKLSGTPLAPRAAAALAQTLARAMAHAHQQGIVHRDLKPGNVLLTADGTPKITDFGLAKLLDSDLGQTRSEAFLGTPSYMAPEQARGDARAVGPAADVYALGAILYELLTGRPPFRGTTILETAEQVRTQDPVPPRQLQPGVPRDLETVCLKCLQKEPQQRYATADDLAEDLRHFLADEPIRARPTPTLRRAFKWGRRHPALVTGLAVTCIAILAGTLLVGYGLSDHAAQLREQEKTREELAKKQTQLEDEGRYATFIRQRDEALFQAVAGTQIIGMDRSSSLAMARDAGRQALAAVPFDEDGKVVPSPYWKADEQAEIQNGCYELLLVLAGALLKPAEKQTGPSPEEIAQAGRYLDRAARLGPTTSAYHARRARYLEAAGKSVEARAAQEQARALRPTTAADFFLQGDAFYRENDLAKARHAFDQALHRRPDHFWAQFYVALCDLSRNETLAAEEGLTACLGRRPDFVWLYLVRGDANRRLGEFEDAEGDFRSALQEQLNLDAQYALYTGRGALRIGERKWQEARADLEKARGLKPASYHAYMNLALLARYQRDDATALALLQETLDRNPPSAERAVVYSRAAEILLGQKRFAEAIADCRAALTARPEEVRTLGLLAQSELEAKRYAEAEQAFTDYLRRGGRPDPNIYRGRGQARFRLGRYADAVEDYTLGLAGGPDATLYNHRGWAYVLLEAWKPALEDFAQALRREPRERDAAVGHSLCRAMLGDYRQAAVEAEAAWNRPPARPEMMHNLACAFAQVAGRAAPGDAALAARARSRAVETLRAALRLVPADGRAAYWRNQMCPDPALDPIRDSAEFRQLTHQYGGQGGAK